jgi:transposase
MTDQDEREQPAPVAGESGSVLRVVGGVDTHRDTHHVAVLDETGRQLADASFPAGLAGYQALLVWLCGFGHVTGVGVEGTASYGAGLTRFLVGHGVRVWEVNRPDRWVRRRKGKSDPLDAAAAARAVSSGDATAVPKTQTGGVEAVRVLHTVRAGAVKARTAAINTLRGLLVTADDQLRDRLRGLSAARLAAACADLTIDDGDDVDVADPHHATHIALHELGHRIQALTSEITRLGGKLKTLTTQLAPATTALFGVGPDTAAQLLITCGDNPHPARQRSRPRRADRNQPAPGLLRTHRPPPPQPRRRPPSQQSPPPNHPRPHAPRPTHPRLRAQTHPTRTIQKGHHAVPQTLPRPHDLPHHHPRPRPHHHLTNNRSIEIART